MNEKGNRLLQAAALTSLWEKT